jgi:hypothetical protein
MPLADACLNFNAGGNAAGFHSIHFLKELGQTRSQRSVQFIYDLKLKLSVASAKNIFSGSKYDQLVELCCAEINVIVLADLPSLKRLYTRLLRINKLVPNLVMRRIRELECIVATVFSCQAVKYKLFREEIPGFHILTLCGYSTHYED